MSGKQFSLALFATIFIVFSIEAASVSKKAHSVERSLSGSSKADNTVPQRENLQDWSYWLSENAVVWEGAEEACKANGDSLLEITSLEKLAQVEEWLRSTDQTVSAAWVGGRYLMQEKKFMWEGGTDIISELWAANEPRQHDSDSCVEASLTGQVLRLKAQPESLESRFICERLTNTMKRN